MNTDTTQHYSPDFIAGYLACLANSEAGTRPNDYLRGWEDRARLEREATTAEWDAVREVVARAVRTPAFDELCERRGDHARAQRHRELTAARGIKPTPAPDRREAVA